jgi:hypothetical protein
VRIAPVVTVRVAIRNVFVVVAAFADCGRRQKGEALPAQHRCPSPRRVAGPPSARATRYLRRPVEGPEESPDRAEPQPHLSWCSTSACGCR